jgi:predicted phage replisome organizer
MEDGVKVERKRYWIKLEKSFLDSKYVKIIKRMPNGTDYVLFYLALMLESVESVGHLKLSDLVPYNEQTLASLTDTNIDIVRGALKVFSDLGMVILLSDGTLFLPEVPKLTGKESESAERVRLYRARKKTEMLQCNTIDRHVEEEKEEQEQEEEQEQKEKENIRGTPNKSATRTTFSKPTFDQVKEYCIERKNTVNADKWYAHYESNGWMVGKNKMKDWKAAVRTWEHNNYDSKTTGYKKPLRDLSGGYTLDDAVYNDEGVI